MKEEEIKKIVRNSKIETSPGFTDRLMLEMESNRVKKPVSIPVFTMILSILGIFSIGISYVLFKNYSTTFILSPLNFQIPGKTIFLIITIILFLAMNYWLRLRDSFHLLQKDPKSVI